MDTLKGMGMDMISEGEISRYCKSTKRSWGLPKFKPLLTEMMLGYYDFLFNLKEFTLSYHK